MSSLSQTKQQISRKCTFLRGSSARFSACVFSRIVPIWNPDSYPKFFFFFWFRIQKNIWKSKRISSGWHSTEFLVFILSKVSWDSANADFALLPNISLLKAVWNSAEFLAKVRIWHSAVSDNANVASALSLTPLMHILFGISLQVREKNCIYFNFKILGP